MPSVQGISSGHYNHTSEYFCECINAAVMYIIDIPDTDAACQKTGVEIMGEKRIHEGGWFQSRRNPASELVVLNVPGIKQIHHPLVS